MVWVWKRELTVKNKRVFTAKNGAVKMFDVCGGFCL